MADAARAVIQTVELSKRYREVVAADRVSFSVAAGEVVGLLGPNGAGKTTLLRMLAGILTPSSGAAYVDGVDMQLDPFEGKRRLGFASGDTALYQRLTPRELLRFFGRLNGMREPLIAERVGQLVSELRMSDFADRRCGNLSAGQRQKTNIARAFLNDPPALVLDEPSTALDLVTGRFLLDAIRRARSAGKAILFSTHALGDAEILCDRVLLIHEGRLVESGTVAEVCARSGQSNLADAFLHRIDALDAIKAS